MSTESESFTSRRPAAHSLPAFSLPPPNIEAPSMARHSLYPPSAGLQPDSFHNPRDADSIGYSYPPSYSPSHGSFPDRRVSSSPSILTPSPGASDGLSPSISSVNTGSSQGSQAPGAVYSYSGLQGNWSASSNSAYTVSSATQAPPALGQQHFGLRSQSQALFGQGPGIHQYSHPRSSQSPATGGEGLPAPPYDQVHHPFQTPISGGGGQTTPPGLSTAHQNQNTLLTSTVSTQPPTPSSVSANADSYTHSRPSNASSYYTASSTPQQSSFPSYTQPSPTQQSPPGHGPIPRGMGQAGMAPPNSYRHYPPYQTLPNMGGSAIMSNIHQPGAQMSMIPGMGVPSYAPIMYGGHGAPPPQSERPFKCDQCTQSFSRNHDLKRHKRIHLAVKPFPCTFCSKSFSRKDALKRHRLVKGCENKANEANEANNGDGTGADRSGEENDCPQVKHEQ
ncbi:hypothetical protein FLONG3_10317 [Fusarium longipes]|uniref:C2H2-type domain-containing protein n=1 Tax=Fusarium longipes TaxID=694270 RepID=A0A395RPU2_9HYPO|nr:hypothetical protein FLONG3_10317 [Fusarium longipes]